MSATAQSYAVNAQELCVLPDIYVKLTDLLKSSDASIDEIAELLSFEPALASHLLKIANSALFNFPKQIDTIAWALKVLGIKELQTLLDAYGVTAAFSGLDPDVLDMDKFWETSVDCALMMKFFAEKKRLNKGQGLFLSGLFHNIGELAMVHSEREKVRYCEGFDKQETPWHRQHDMFGFTFADCSVELLKLWQLPNNIIDPIHQHNHGYTDELPTEGLLLYVASRLAVCNSHPGLYRQERLIGQHVLDELNFTSDDLNEAIDYCNAQGMEIMAIIRS